MADRHIEESWTGVNHGTARFPRTGREAGLKLAADGQGFQADMEESGYDSGSREGNGPVELPGATWPA